MLKSPDRALTVKDVAAEYGVKPATVYGWIGDKKLPTIRLPGGAYRFRRSDLDEFDRQCRDRNSDDQIIDSDAEGKSGSSIGPTNPPVELDPFRRGRHSASRLKGGKING